MVMGAAIDYRGIPFAVDAGKLVCLSSTIAAERFPGGAFTSHLAGAPLCPSIPAALLTQDPLGSCEYPEFSWTVLQGRSPGRLLNSISNVAIPACIHR